MKRKKLARAAEIQAAITDHEEMLDFLADNSNEPVQVIVGGREFELANPVVRTQVLSALIDRVGKKLDAAREAGHAL